MAAHKLSEWVAACEGTMLGEPSVCAEQEGDGDLELYIDCGGAFGGVPYPSREDRPDIRIVINTGYSARVYLARDAGGCYENCDTPQELRLCLTELTS